MLFLNPDSGAWEPLVKIRASLQYTAESADNWVTLSLPLGSPMTTGTYPEHSTVRRPVLALVELIFSCLVLLLTLEGTENLLVNY